MSEAQSHGDPVYVPTTGAIATDPDRPSFLFFALWCVLLASGFAALSAYGLRGEAPAAVGAWPGGEEIALAPDRPTLALFIHPRCPCTAATVAELDRLLSRNPRAFSVAVVMTIPEQRGERWLGGATFAAVQRLPGVAVVPDPGGIIAARFGARDSGTVLAFVPDGARLFAGGVTATRGHEGASTGGEALAALAVGRVPRTAETPVFGCPLVLPGTMESGHT